MAVIALISIFLCPIAVKAENVTLISPADNSYDYFDYPDYTHNVYFSWVNITPYNYSLIIAKDASFNLIVVNKSIPFQNSSTETLEPNSYWWKVGTYNDSSAQYENFSNTSRFYLVRNASTGVGVEGFVYEIVDGVKIPLTDAIVYTKNQNLNWSANTITDSNGYYIFQNLTSSITYQLFAKKTGYENSEYEYVVPTGVLIINKDIMIEKCISGFNCFYNQHYVKFTVQNIWFTKYTGVTATVYKGSELTVSDTKITGTDGSVNILLIKDVMYRITFINATQGISVTWTGTPAQTQYYIITDATTSSWDTHGTDASENIDITISTNMDGSTGYINASYSDALAQTNGLIFYLNKTIPGDANNQSNLQIINAGTNNTYNASFTLSDYSGQSYIITARINHGTYGVIRYSYGVAFPALPSPLTNFDPTIVLMLFVGLILFFSSMFGQTSHVQGMAIICGFVWILSGIGIFSNVNAGAGFYLALSLATVISVVANINERGKHEGLQ